MTGNIKFTAIAPHNHIYAANIAFGYYFKLIAMLFYIFAVKLAETAVRHIKDIIETSEYRIMGITYFMLLDTRNLF